MIQNATLTGHQKRSGNDAEGRATFTAYPGSWPCCAQRTTKTHKADPGGQAIPVALEVFVAGLPAIAAGDLVSVDGTQFAVLESGMQPGGLRNLRLLLGPKA